MVGFHFDAIARSLTTAGSRRRAVVLALSGTLGLFGTAVEEATAKNCKKIKNKKKRKKCLARTKMAPTTPTCIRDCAGKTCGDDGCGGSCGPCTGGSCSGGACVCPRGLVVCGTRCAQGNGSLVSCPPAGSTTECCSGNCRELIGTGSAVCLGRAVGDACEVPAQCETNVCTGGVCSCPSGQTRKPGTAECCITNGATCGPNLPGCCAGPNQCTGPNSTCVALASGEECTFDPQCDSGICEPDCSTAPFCTIQEFCA